VFLGDQPCYPFQGSGTQLLPILLYTISPGPTKFGMISHVGWAVSRGLVIPKP